MTAPAARRPFLACLGLALALGSASLALPSAPGYDPWSWLIWGRELAGLELSTSEGPAWKPLPVLVTAPLSAVSTELAPAAWLVVARAGAVFAVLLAALIARRLAGGSLAAGVAAGAGVVLLPGWVENAAVGNTEGLVTSFLLLAAAGALEGRPRTAFSWCAAAALLRVEAWPFLAASAYVLVGGDRAARPAVALTAVGVPALWFGPELLGSGELLRSVDRARVPNPGAPALSARPALAALAAALRLPPPVALIGAALVAVLAAGPTRWRAGARGAAHVVGGGAAWILIVAAMSELGFSGEPRYLLPGAALIVVGGLAALFRVPSLLSTSHAQAPARPGAGTPAPDAMPGQGRRARWALGLGVALALAATGLARADAVREEMRRASHGAALASDLERAIKAAGGPRALLRCGPPYVGPYRGPLLAWALGVHKERVGFTPKRPGVAIRSRLRPNGPIAPPRPPGGRPSLLVHTAAWEIAGACRDDRAQN